MEEKSPRTKPATWWERLISVETTSEEEARIGRVFNTLMLISVGIVLSIALAFVASWALGLMLFPTMSLAVSFPLFFVPFSLICMIYAKKGYVKQMMRLYVWVDFVGITLAAFIFDGIRSPAWLLYIWIVTIAGTLLAPAYALGMVGLVGAYYALLGVLTVTGVYRPLFLFRPEARTLLFTSFTGIMMVSTVGLLTYINTRSLQDAFARLRATTRELEEHRRRLEQQVAERTADLARRMAHLEAAAQVARRAAEIRGVRTLLDETVHLISDSFGFYHTGIFLLDEAGRYAILQAASSEAGRQMVEQGHRLKVGETGIVGWVASTGRPRIALDVGGDAAWFDNPDLPKTRAEMALPLKVGEQIIGVLDVQSEHPDAFTEGDISILQTLADQIALAIEDARLLERMERTVRELEHVYGEYTQEAWRAVRRARRWMSRRYRHLHVEQAEEPTEEARQALSEGRPVLRPLRTEEGEQTTGTLLAVPMKLRGQTIGVLRLRLEGESAPDTVALVEEIADRLALALENARLLEETRRRAAWERKLSSVTARVRAEAEIDTIVERALEELGRALDAERAFVHLSGEFVAPTAGGGDGRTTREVER